MDLKDTYDRIAEDWHRDHLKDDWWFAWAEKLVGLLPDGARVLDVGCGGGTKARWLADRGFSVTGVDISEKMIEIAQREYPGIAFQVLDMRDVGTLPETYDAITAWASFLHLKKSEVLGVLRACRDRLNPGGLISVTVKHIRPGQAEEEQKTEDDYGYAYTRFFSYHTLDEMRQFVSDAGFRIVHADHAGIWIQVVGRK